MPTTVPVIQLPPHLSSLEAALSSLEPQTSPGSKESAKAAVLLRLLDKPTLSGEKLIETLVRSDDQEITLSLKEYVKSVRFSAGFYGVIFGVLGGSLLGLFVGVAASIFLYKTPAVREIYHVPYFVNEKLEPVVQIEN